MEGRLFAASEPGHYLIGSAEGPALLAGRAIEIFLAGSWISGHVAVENGESGLADDSQYRSDSGDEDDDIVTEASEESFPASDPPAWTTDTHRTLPSQLSKGTQANFYFVADSDGSMCGFCQGMRIRMSS